MRARTNYRKRQGTVLIYFGLIVFVILGMAALVIDIGLAMVTQRQMQTAADTAALEGLRARDAETDDQRRQEASNLVAYVFDDNLNPQDGDPLGISAGPVVDFTGGIDTTGGFKAAQTMSVANPYKPVLQLNSSNDVTGDMVSGTYISSGSHQEKPDYTREDFQPDQGNPSPSGNAFLVRLRRTGEANNAGVSSASPPLPYLFGRGSLLAPANKARGILVRATAIASAQAALSAGLPNPDARFKLPGATPFVLLRTQWENMPVDTPVALSSDGTGNITVNGAAGAGYTFTPQTVVAIGQPAQPASLVMVGQAATPSGAALDLTNYALFLYVPLVQTVNSSAGAAQTRVVGFGRLDLSPDPANTGQFRITKRNSKIAAVNASAVLAGSLDADLAADPGQRKAVLSANAALGAPLLVPALVR